MDRRDIAQLRKRFKKDDCTITRMAGCYVDLNRNKIVKLNENFLNLPDEEFYKYLELAKKTMSGTVGNNILEVNFASGEEGEEKQRFFMGLRASQLKNEELLDCLYDLIIDNYRSLTNYLILVFHDFYDIMSRTSDRQKLDESEEVYEYLLVSICPVELPKAGLGYRREENKIGALVRDPIVSAPALGFLFPAFSQGSADVDKIDYFIKDPKDSKSDFIESVLGCTAKKTGVENRKAFAKIIREAFDEDEEKAEEALTDIQESFKIRCDEAEAVEEESLLSAPIVLDSRIIEEILKENDIPEAKSRKIQQICEEEFADDTPVISSLVDEKALDKSLKEREKRELVKEVAKLKTQLESSTSEGEIIVKVSDEKADEIITDLIDGKRYVMIPVDENDEIKVNGRITEW